ncbi:hypothetical protein B0T24DRAFT_578117 [Lasiosphaeria ovina]|uniref:Uncharacterized protein n=1 Tax=Lasiosphaeria ovina TaxID=92902 RepID=A0AAE0K7P4_9PEZI|nr:hypothetical protein B0T24DRAFT_578117 [Lasiosphaeria ovina]
MSQLIPVPKSAVSVRYHGLGRFLRVHVKTVLSSIILSPFIQQESRPGGLKFSTRGFYSGYQSGVEVPVEFKFDLPILLPIPRFDNKTVLVETSLGTHTIAIEYVEWPAPPSDGDDSSATVDATAATETKQVPARTDVLPTEERLLHDHGSLVISAKIPPPLFPDGGDSVDISFNKDFIKVDTARIVDGSIAWTIKWATVPKGDGEDPQPLSVTTTRNNGYQGPATQVIRTVQNYSIRRVWLVKPEPEPEAV